MKDNFSTAADKYAKYRPTYPLAIYDYLLSVVPTNYAAWDCGTGNGQVANQLSRSFKKIYATDISEQQLKNALPNPNIEYTVQPAEQTNFTDNFFDLVVVGQAVHWFDFAAFYNEVNRTLKHKGIIAVIGYSRPQVSPEIDLLITDFYHNVIGSFWDKERRYVDENYKTIPFPFKELKTPEIKNSVSWSFEHLLGYLETWSAVKHFQKEKRYNPITTIRDALEKSWKKAITKVIHFPILFRAGQIDKNV